MPEVFRIQTDAGPWAVEGDKFGEYLAVHFHDDSNGPFWRITHLPTGLAIRMHLEEAKVRRWAQELLDSGIDFDFTLSGFPAVAKRIADIVDVPCPDDPRLVPKQHRRWAETIDDA